MNDFHGLADAKGLDAGQANAIRRLLDVRSRVSGRNGMLRAYYDGRIHVEDFGITIESEKLQNDQVCFWPEKAVTSLSERERFDGFVFEDGYTDASLSSAVRDNCLVSAYQRYNPSKLLHGVMFACVNSVGGRPQVRFHSAETAWAEPDGNYDSGRIGAGIAVARQGRAPWSGSRLVPLAVNLYEPGRVTTIERTAIDRWIATPHELPHGECMMFAFVHKSTGTRPFGQSRITPAVMSLTRDAVRTTWHMALSGAFYAMPKMALLGLSDEQFDAMVTKKQQYYIDAMWLFTRDKAGNTPEPRQFSGNSPEPFIRELEYYAGQFSGATGVPTSALGVEISRYTSSDAMAAANEQLVKAAKDDIEADSDVLRRIALMMMAVSANTGIDGLTDDQMTVAAHFMPPDMPSLAAQADSALKTAQAAPWIADTDLFLERLGFSQADIMRVRRARDSYVASAALDSLIASAMPQIEAEAGAEAEGGES